MNFSQDTCLFLKTPVYFSTIMFCKFTLPFQLFSLLHQVYPKSLGYIQALACVILFFFFLIFNHHVFFIHSVGWLHTFALPYYYFNILP